MGIIVDVVCIAHSHYCLPWSRKGARMPVQRPAGPCMLLPCCRPFTPPPNTSAAPPSNTGSSSVPATAEAGPLIKDPLVRGAVGEFVGSGLFQLVGSAACLGGAGASIAANSLGLIPLSE